MTDAAIVLITRVTVCVGSALAVGGTIVSFASGEIELWWRSFAGLCAVLTLCFGLLPFVVAHQRQR